MSDVRIVTSTLVALSIAAAIPANAANNPAPSQTVIVNTSSNPVPVKPVGTTAVEGTVTIGNTSVPVTVTNDGTQPLPVRPLDGRRPFTWNGEIQLTGTDSVLSTSFKVPQGKMLVIEHIAANAVFWDLAGQKMFVEVLALHYNDDFTFALQNLPLIPSGGVPYIGTYTKNTAMASVRAFADAGTDVSIYATRGIVDPHLDSVQVTIAGYLVDTQ